MTGTPGRSSVTSAAEAAAPLREFLRDDLSRTLGAVRRTACLGVALAIVCVAALGYVRTTLMELVTPANVSDLATGAAMAAIPDASRELERQLSQTAPALADLLMSQAGDAVGTMRLRLEGRIGDFLDGLSRGAPGDLADAFDQALRAGGAGSPDERVAQATSAAIAKLEAASASASASAVGAQVGNQFFRAFNDSVRDLRDAGAGLQAAVDGRSATRPEALERRLIQTWLSFSR